MTKTMMPQEIEVWYILPAIRRALAQEMAKGKLKLKQKEIARYLGLTEPAVSQYVSSKRGSDLKFPKDIQAEIKKSAGAIAKKKDSHTSLKELQRISALFNKNHAICEIHHSHDKSLPKKCDICYTP